VSINRREFVSTSILSIAGLGLSRPLAAQAPAQAGAPQPPVTKFEEIRRGVGYFTGNGGTIGYLVSAERAIVIDSQFMPTAEICVAGLKQRAPKGIEMLINTHHHGDHTSGNPAFRPVVKRILAHENCVAWQRKVAEEAAAKPPAAGAPAPAAPVVADSTFKDVWDFELGSEKGSVRYFGPGHTSGDAVIFFERANVVHAGDLLFRRVHPRVDGPAGASVVNWHATLVKLLAAHDNDTAYIFGHGKDGVVLGKKADVEYFRDYLAAALEEVRGGIKAGRSKEEIAKTPALKGFEDVAQVNPRINLAGVLEAAFGELAKK
jgi:glyoxylase-like metal-dependent hydrolase (beta-lactamase superfamily II)